MHTSWLLALFVLALFAVDQTSAAVVVLRTFGYSTVCNDPGNWNLGLLYPQACYTQSGQSIGAPYMAFSCSTSNQVQRTNWTSQNNGICSGTASAVETLVTNQCFSRPFQDRLSYSYSMLCANYATDVAQTPVKVVRSTGPLCGAGTTLQPSELCFRDVDSSTIDYYLLGCDKGTEAVALKWTYSSVPTNPCQLDINAVPSVSKNTGANNCWSSPAKPSPTYSYQITCSGTQSNAPGTTSAASVVFVSWFRLFAVLFVLCTALFA